MMKRCPEEVAAIVRGDALPSFTHLYELCLLTDQEPGYFLDSQVRHASHRMAIVSPPFPSREDLAVCLPREFNDLLENPGSLIYELAYTDHGYGIEAGDFVIVKSYKEPECIQVGMLYFMIKAIGFEIRRCIEIKGNRAYFDTSGFSGRPMSLVIKRHFCCGPATDPAQPGGSDMAPWQAIANALLIISERKNPAWEPGEACRHRRCGGETAGEGSLSKFSLTGAGCRCSV